MILLVKRLIEMAKYFVKFILYFGKNTDQKSLKKVFVDLGEMILFITHNFKGGTIQYENNFVQEQNGNVIVLKIITHGKILAYSIENKANGEKCLLNKNSFSEILNYKYKKIIVNSLVGTDNIKEIFAILKKYKINHQTVPLIYLVHDFHCICPKYNLIAKKEFCYLNCHYQKCKFHYYPDCTVMPIHKWRELWYNFLRCIDEIVCFSVSSKELILKAYPHLNAKKITIYPHNMDWCHFSPIKITSVQEPRIAIVGKVDTIPKGKLVVQEILAKASVAIPFYFIGTTSKEIKSKRKNVFYYGRYNHDRLQDILEEQKINFVVFPSVCPETFSYLVSELIMMDLPIICFDYGAQAEKISHYNKGIVVKNSEEMISHIEEIYKAGVCKNDYK